MNLEEKRIDGKEIFKGYVLKLVVDDVLLPDGSKSKREVIRHSGAVCIAPITKNKELIFVRQYRYAVGSELLELPAGRIDPDESPKETGIRELEEETGYSAENTTYIGKLYPTPGYSDEVIYLYACTVDDERGETDPDEGEFVETELIPIEKAVEMVMDDEIPDSKTQILILKLNEALRQGKIDLED